MDFNNQVLNLCVKGTQAEFEGKINVACALYLQAWNAARVDVKACIAAHYMARCQDSLEDILRWNREALVLANECEDAYVKHFYPSQYLNLGNSYEPRGDQNEAKKYFDLAAELGFLHHIE